MDHDLVRISRAGDVNGLYELIRDKPAVLKKVDNMMFVDTPLHIAAKEGQTCFALEMMNLMPSFARKLNRDGLSPIHLALSNGHSELVLLLLRADPDLVRVKGRGGKTHLHYAAENGNIDILVVFLSACPKSIEDMTVESETVFHIAVKSNSMEALKVLVGWLKRVCHEDVSSWKTGIVNWRDIQGNTVFDIAESNRQNEASFNLQPNAIKLLAQINPRRFTGPEILLRSFLFLLGLLPNNKINLANYLRSNIALDEELAVLITRQRRKISQDLCNALLVVGGVIIAATFQAVFSPPGGLRQDNGNPTIMINGTNYINTTTVTNTTGSGGSPSSDAGKSVMDISQFIIFSYSNNLVFCTGVLVMGFLLSDGLFGVFMVLVLVYLLLCYFTSINVISPYRQSTILNVSFLFFFVILLMPVLRFYSSGKVKISQLHYNANKYPKEAVADRDQRNDTDPSV
ncbi:hypothetical protein PTKIN_Ptkin05aG0024800 [Pterospermum kingtungense]